MQTQAEILDWVSKHFNLAWGTGLIAFLWKCARFITKIEARFVGGEQTLNKIATNDLPHIHGEMVNINTNLQLMTSTFKSLTEAIWHRGGQ